MGHDTVPISILGVGSIILHTGPCPPMLKQRFESIPYHSSVKLIEMNDSLIPLPPLMKSQLYAWRVSFQKLAVFSLTQFEKIVFLDSDTMLLQNVDELFGLPSLSAAMDNCDRCTLFHGMNAGVLVLEPSGKVWQSIKDYTKQQSCLSKIFEWWDQELLTCLFDHRQPVEYNVGNWYQLPHVYNLFIKNCNCKDRSKNKDPFYSTWNDSDVKVVHYACSDKPWENVNVAGGVSHRDSVNPKSCQDRFNDKWLAFWHKGIELLGMKNSTNAIIANGIDKFLRALS